MTAAPIRVLIVDDSPTMRALLRHHLTSDPDIRVVGEAADPLEAREAIKSLDPHVVTLDVEMPNMNGLEFLARLMRLRPTPVVMVSTLTQKGADATLAALELGAVDCVGKPTGHEAGGFASLIEKVKVAAGARVKPAERPVSVAPEAGFSSAVEVVALGASTGGVEALLTILQTFPANCPPTVITQHMPASFTTSFAARLDRTCTPKVAEARDAEPLRQGHVYLAPGGAAHLKVVRAGAGLVCRLDASDLVSGHRPSVDVLFSSVARSAGASSVGAILTGMGRDGATGLLEMSRAGARTLGQDEASSTVYGMPRAASEAGAVQIQVPLERMGAAILRAASRRASEIA